MNNQPVPDSATSSLRVYLIRHGETEWTQSGRYTGLTDIPLTARGEADARAVGERLRKVSFAAVLTSPLQRAQQTCALAALQPGAETESDLTEWDNGDYEGHVSAEIHARHPAWSLFRDGGPNGESPAQVSARADHLIARLRTLEGNVALFSHGHLGRVLGARWIGLSVAQAQGLLLATTSISILSYEHRRSATPAILLWNDVSAASAESDSGI
ncbi:MAG: histidine phosphatase family protein [Gemmatimonadaceae bacterium]